MKLNRRSAECGTSGTTEPAESLIFFLGYSKFHFNRFIGPINYVNNSSNLAVLCGENVRCNIFK